ncbi:hypothetical protein [Neorhodopirellula lusitana]|uniref:hypothetical protein n=1 Tax=Neorhodopirellula lusitana TaxID=445327 RepID=UPI00384CEE05
MRIILRSRASRPRNGSAIILSIMAIAVISLASLAVVRSHKRMNYKQSALQARTEGRLVADGLIHREVAYWRTVADIDASARANATSPPDKTLEDSVRFSKATIGKRSVDSGRSTMDLAIVLYDKATVAASQRTSVDIAPLSP